MTRTSLDLEPTVPIKHTRAEAGNEWGQNVLPRRINRLWTLHFDTGLSKHLNLRQQLEQRLTAAPLPGR